ncbi:MAG: type II toxin-antitoxin system VapC family toxin [Chloroflexi bacterium]|nr:MAG: type II toxin-antitoxin system VapC family toxin [Chloroflexota bacterium]
MRILLDTQIFLWYIIGDRQIPAPVLQAVRDPSNEVFLSVVAIWGAVIKYQLGNLPLPQPPELYLPEQRRLHRIVSLNVDEASVVQLGQLPALHRDPFDRLMICQAIEHSLLFATVDKAIHSYPVMLLS